MWFDTDLFDAWNNLFIRRKKVRWKDISIAWFESCVDEPKKLETVESEVYIIRRVIWFSCIISHVEANKIGLERIYIYILCTDCKK